MNDNYDIDRSRTARMIFRTLHNRMQPEDYARVGMSCLDLTQLSLITDLDLKVDLVLTAESIIESFGNEVAAYWKERERESGEEAAE